MQPTQNQPTGAPPGTFNPQYGIGGQQSAQMPGQQVDPPGLIATFRSPAATSQQFQAMSGLYATGAVAATVQYTGQFLGMGAPMVRPFMMAATSQGTVANYVAKGLAGVDPFFYAGKAYQAGARVGGAAMHAEQAFMSRAVNARRVGGLLTGGIAATGVGLAGLALTEGIIHAGGQLYEGAKGAAQGMGFAAEHMSNFNYSRQQAQNLGAHGGFLDSASQMMGTNYEGISQMTGMLTQQGDMRGVKNMSQFKERLISKLKQIKDLSKEADVSLAEANQILQALKQQGFNEMAGANGITSLKDASSALMNRARSAGIDPNALMQAGQMGAQSAYGLGLGRAYGSAMGQSMLGTITNMYDNNTVNRAYVDQMGGTQNVAGIMSQKIMQSTQSIGMAILKQGASGMEIDYDKLRDLQTGKTTLDDEMAAIQKGASSSSAFAKQINDRIHGMINDPKLNGEIQKVALGLLRTQASVNPTGMSHTLQMSEKQIELMGGMIAGSSAEAAKVETERRNSLARSQETALLQRSEQFGYDTYLSNKYLSGADRSLQRVGRGIMEAGADFAGQFRDSNSEVTGISRNDLDSFRELIKERADGTAISARQNEIAVNTLNRTSAGFGNGGLSAMHRQYGMGTDNMGGLIFGGLDGDIREALYSDPNAQRFLTTSKPFGREGMEYLQVDRTGLEMFGDSVYFDMAAANSARVANQRGRASAEARFDKQNQAVSENLVAMIRSRGKLRTGRRESFFGMFDLESQGGGALSDTQVMDLYQDFLDAGGRKARSVGFQSKASSDKAKLDALRKVGVTGISQKNNPAIDSQIAAAVSNLSAADRQKYDALYMSEYNKGQALTSPEEIRGFLQESLKRAGATSEEVEGLGANISDLDLGFSTVEDARKKLAQGQFGYVMHTKRSGLASIFSNTKTTTVAGLEETDFDKMSASQMVQIGKILKDKKLTDAQKESSIRKLGVAESFTEKIREGLKDAAITGNTTDIDKFQREISAFGAHVLDREVGGKIAEDIRAQGASQAGFLTSLGVDFKTVDSLKNFDALTSDASGIGKSLLMTGLNMSDKGDQARFFEGLGMAGYGDVASRANIAAGLMSQDQATRERAAKSIGLGSASVSTPLTADQATDFLKQKGLLNVMDMAASGKEGAGGSRLKVNDFGSAVMAFHQAVNIFAANASGEPADAAVFNQNNSTGSSGIQIPYK